MAAKPKAGAQPVGKKTTSRRGAGVPSSRAAKGGTTRPLSSRGKSATSLVIVESPAKARTIERILGRQFVVKASQGHVRDLPKDKLGIDTGEEFAPSYSVLEDKRSVVEELRKLGGKASSIYLATDPDREGESISWHLVKAAGWDNGNTALHRVVFHEITPEAVKRAFDHPRAIDMELVNSQQARRVLDRLVGYQISPLLWRKVQRGLSAGRVQSVALRLVVDREKEIIAFVPKEYWTIDAELQAPGIATAEGGKVFTAALQSIKGQKGKLEITNEATARGIEDELKGATYTIAKVRKREAKQTPAAPFITSTLQQEAWRKLRMPAVKTMRIAQQLYEGLALPGEGAVGLITYMRTDSTQVAQSAIREARQYIRDNFGEEYHPAQTRVFRKKAKGAQEAHEAIRPTSIQRRPQDLKPRLSADQSRLYDLIWRRMLASQMADAISDTTTVDTEAKPQSGAKVYIFRASGSVQKFPGFRVLYQESGDDGHEEEGKVPLPQLAPGDRLDCLKLEAKQHFTQPPARYSEASLIRSLEENGIGRPSTYAPTISTIVDRHYALRQEGRLVPTQLGTTVCDLLTEYFSDIMDINFTAEMEEELDEVARGERQWVPMLRDFYGPFQKALETATETMPRVKVEEATDEVCEKCGDSMVIKTGRFGRFIACSNFPACKNTRQLGVSSPTKDGEGQASPAGTEETTEEVCEKCGHSMVIKTGRFGKFLACTDYPKCKNSKPLKIGVPCPRCGADLVQRRGRGKGRTFYGCSRYPDCDFLVNRRPVPEPCPECSGLMVASGRGAIHCTTCAWKGDVPAEEPAAVEA